MGVRLIICNLGKQNNTIKALVVKMFISAFAAIMLTVYYDDIRLLFFLLVSNICFQDSGHSHGIYKHDSDKMQLCFLSLFSPSLSAGISRPAAAYVLQIPIIAPILQFFS